MTSCTYPTCTGNGRCPIIVIPLGKRCPAKARPADEQRELDARLPLGDDVWRDGVVKPDVVG